MTTALLLVDLACARRTLPAADVHAASSVPGATIVDCESALRLA